MVDLTWCDRPLSRWIHFKAGINYFLEHPALMLLAMVGLAVVLWWLPKPVWPQWLNWFPVVGLLLYFLSLTPPMVNLATWGLVQFLPPDSGTTADAIVVLGRGEALQASRTAIAAQLWRSQRAERIFVSGREDGPEIVQRLAKAGIPMQVLAEEGCSQTTAENAQFTAMVLQPLGVNQIILVTDPPHMLRSLLTFRSVGFTVIPHASDLPELAPIQRSLLVLREYAGLISYAIKGRFRPQTTAITAAPWQTSLGQNQPERFL